MGRFTGEFYEEFIQKNQKKIIRRSLFDIYNLIGDTSAVWDCFGKISLRKLFVCSLDISCQNDEEDLYQ